MTRLIGSVILVIGHIWVTISSCAMMIVGFLVWLGILIWLASSWGGLIWVVLWLFIGGGLTAGIVGLLSFPARILGASLVVLGERLANPENEWVDVPEFEACTACGSKREFADEHYCRACGAPYG